MAKILVLMLLVEFFLVFGWFLSSSSSATASVLPNPSSSPNSIDPLIIHQEFENFITEYGKNYTTEEERSKRFQIFTKTFNYIAEFNRTRGPNTTFDLGINFFADLDDDELEKFCGDLPVSDSDEDYVRDDEEEERNMYNMTDQLPASVDWRSKGAVTSVKDQTSPACGGCWAFGTIAALEGLVQIRKKKLVELSVQELIDCVEGSSCRGGYPDDAYEYILENQISSEEFYSYVGFKHTYCANAITKREAKIDQYEQVPQGNELALKRRVAAQPVTVGICSDKAYYTYRRGVFSHDCPGGRTAKLNHVVAVVGYGTDAHGTDFWIIKDSQGTNWGERGFMRMKRGVGLRRIARYAFYPVIVEF
ncbi:OLC1v1002047C1 [Oldenlandia corymbosa var. corymbosa]|uniref:OLC1v1002047C1 n=1 Tax=Oldenlandia corymbosa var. corymbosa TaxID=529605 RepID=A0AAV1D6Q4_OLDCO|nr:OLC1v1002047C1 [Oldenlandia corymbosa var. corymbosa]